MHQHRSQRVIRVGVVEDHELVRELICERLVAHDRISIEGEAASVGDATALLDADLDVLVTDFGLPDGTGLDLCRLLQARHSRTKCVILTAENTSELLDLARAAGAAALVAKQVNGLDVSRIVVEVADGATPITHQS